MPGRNLGMACKALSALFILLLGADWARAYVGPGTDVAFISYAMTLLLWVAAAFSAVLLWPIYALLHKIRGRRHESTTASSLEAEAEKGHAATRTNS